MAALQLSLNPPTAYRHRNFLRLPPSTAATIRHRQTQPTPLPPLTAHRRSVRNPTPLRAFDAAATEEIIVDSSDGAAVAVAATPSRFQKQAAEKEEFPDAPAFEIRKEVSPWEGLLLKLRLLVAPPWQRVAQGSVLCMSLAGTITDVKGRWLSPELTLPEICESFAKAANDPRISGIFLKINNIDCGWAKLDEIRRHILKFRESGKFVVGYMNGFMEREYYLGCACDELYAHQLAPFSLFGFTLSSYFLRGVFEKMGLEPQWVRIGKYKKAGDQVARRSISEHHLEVLNNLVDGRYENFLETVSSSTGKTREEVENFMNEGVYEMERVKEEGLITDILYEEEVMSILKARLGVPEEKDLPTVDYKKYSKVSNWTLGLNEGEDEIGVIRASGLIVGGWTFLNMPGSAVLPSEVIKQLRKVRDSKKYKAAIIRIDSSGGEALASDLIWREIQQLAKKKPVIASLSDMSASGGYYIAMSATAIVAEKLSVGCSIGVIQGQMNYSKLHERIGLHRDSVSRGRFGEFPGCAHRPLRYLVELSRPNSALPEFVNALGTTIAGFGKAMSMGSSFSGAQARFDGGELSSGFDDPIFAIMKYFLKVSQAGIYD
ncbi:Serine protease SPPA, chloroplastic [Linum perenne]